MDGLDQWLVLGLVFNHFSYKSELSIGKCLCCTFHLWLLLLILFVIDDIHIAYQCSMFFLLIFHFFTVLVDFQFLKNSISSSLMQQLSPELDPEEASGFRQQGSPPDNSPSGCFGTLLSL